MKQTMKKLITICGAMAVLALSGCSDPVSIQQTSYGVKSDASTGQAAWDKIYTNQNLKVSTFCTNACEKAYIFELPIYSTKYDGEYTMPVSNKMDLILGAQVTFVFNRDGGESAIKERLKFIANKYQARVSGSASDNQKLTWTIGEIAAFDMPLSKFKSIVRPILSTYDIMEAHANIASMGSIAVDIEAAIRKHLKDNNSVLKLFRLEFHQVELPPAVKIKNTQEFNLIAQERIQERQLTMKRNRVKTTHLLNLEELQNDAELIMLIKPLLSNEVLAYKWIQAFNNSVENGIPVAITPEMLAPAVGKVIDKSFNMDKFMETVKKRKSQVEKEISSEQDCAETTDGCNAKDSK
jgi:uncharacterized protein YceK